MILVSIDWVYFWSNQVLLMSSFLIFFVKKGGKDFVKTR